jgi:Fur family ferric uptake transcriptional regulator
MAGKTTYRTRAQEELLAFLKTTPGQHYTAAEIKNHFAGQENPIGTATIYRQLERFVDEGCVRKYVIGPGDSACYAYVKDQQCASHFHCRCDVCGRLIHLDSDELREIQAYLLDQHGFSWDSGKTVFYGICDQCRKA